MCAAKVRFVLVACELNVFSKDAVEVAADFHERVVSSRQFAMNSHADARLKVGVVAVLGGHAQWYGAVGKQHLAATRVDACRIGLKAGASGQALAYDHCHQRRNVALARCRYAFVV